MDFSKQFLENLNLPKLSDAEKIACDEELTINDLKEALLSMEGGKSPGNNGLNKEWYVFFGRRLKKLFMKVSWMLKIVTFCPLLKGKL